MALADAASRNEVQACLNRVDRSAMLSSIDAISVTGTASMPRLDAVICSHQSPVDLATRRIRSGELRSLATAAARSCSICPILWESVRGNVSA